MLLNNVDIAVQIMNTSKLLIFANVWPEPNSSAAGGRMLQLINTFTKHNFVICYACTAAPSAFAVNLSAIGVQTKQVALNDDVVDDLLLQFNATIVLFDRFMTEEQFGWRVAKVLPKALRVLNTEDLHCVRRSRQKAFKTETPWSERLLIENEDTKREIAAIFRCDISLIISKVEMDLLKRLFNVPSTHLYYYPFIANKQTNNKTFSEREGFVSIGNMMHQPNWQSVLTLKDELWPRIKALKPNATIAIYGAYCSEKVTQLNNTKTGFLVKGRAENALEVIQNSRVLLAPLMFGAGLKGKLLEAMACGTPSITTTIGAEGMAENSNDWGGVVTNNWDDFAEAAVALYDNESSWHQAVEKGEKLFNSQFTNFQLLDDLLSMLHNLKDKLENHRLKNFTGAMLMHHRLQSTKFMSKWIAAKNKE